MATLHFVFPRPALAALFFLLFTAQQLNGVLSMKVFTASTLPTGITAACAAALTSDVTCSPVISALQNGYYYSQTMLESLCTASCKSSLETYENGVGLACAEQIWKGYFDEEMPIVIVADLLRYQYDQSCLMDAGRYCNVIAAQAATAQDPSAPLGGGAIGGGNVTACDLCLVKKLRFLASSPYYDGPLLQPVYSSKTSSCKLTGYPLTTSTLGFFPPISIPPSTPTPCSGQTYSIQSTDDCKSISKSKSIGTGWLLSDNQLSAFCAGFPATGSLCLVNTCSTYTVQQTDTCDSVSKAHKISTTQLLAWNPVLNAGCNNIAKAVGYEICVGQPGTKYIAPDTPAATVSTAAPRPTDIAVGTNAYCARFYKALLGDYCNLLIMKFAISLPDFVFLNSAINVNCTNLYADESYCVQAVGDINTYSGRPGFPTPTLTVPASVYDLFPDATFVSTPNNDTALPFATGTRTDCNWYIKGSDFQEDWAGSMFLSNCDAVAALYGAGLNALGTWNPSLGDTGLPSCKFDPAYQYCALLPESAGTPSAPTIPPVPIRAGASPKCTEYFPVFARTTCQQLLDLQALTIAQFFAYNPAVGADCSGLWPDYQYCVRTPDYVDERPTTTTTPGTITSTPTPTTTDAPKQPGQPPNCNAWYTVVSGDWCGKIIDTYHLSAANFYAWNPAVSTDCTSGLWAGYAYCVGTSGSSTPTTKTTSISTPPPPPPPPTPTSAPTQPGQPANCNAWYTVVSGDWCGKIIDAYHLSAANFYAWNPAVSTDCTSGLWAGYAYCVGISGSSSTKTTTTTSTKPPPPSPTQPNSIAAKCNKFALAMPGDYCLIFAEHNGISTANLYAWNTVLGSNGAGCGSSFWGGYYYCVGVSA